MGLFVAGLLVGASAVVTILGFLAVLAEEQEREEAARKKQEREQRTLEDIENRYKNCD